MNSPVEITAWLDQVLPSIQKPGRYYGGELNQVMKKWDDVDIHVALAFPDIYDLGMPNLGLAILYDSINKRPDALAERVYSPWLDMEAAMRRDKIPLFGLESRHPLNNFEILGISLPYETLYTNALNLLDLSGLPLKSKDRLDTHPLIIAGGHAITNPEPMAPFIDAFAIGDGEEIIHEIIDRVIFSKQNAISRKELLISLAHISGVYVSLFYKPIYQLGGMLETIKPKFKSIPARVQKRIVAKLPPPVCDFIVPSIDIVHNRISVEIMRGCTRGCRFCHAGMITRPVRERSVEVIINSIDAALNKTGYEEIALLSLSSSDYTHIQELVNEISSRFKGKHLTISLPSLRIESLSIDLLQKLIESRQSSFTLAPEAGSDHMRNRINKPIPERALLDLAYEIYSRGWLTIKLYFMIGLPGESEDDVRAVARICKAVISEGRKIHGNKASLNISIGTFIPKPHTPFQWEPLEKKETIESKQQILRNELRLPGIKVSWPDQKSTMLESWLSRGDRRISEVIYIAWSLGAKFDAWQDHSRYEIWEAAFRESKVDPSFYVHRQRDEKEYFPWDIVDIGVKKSFLLQDHKWSQEGKLRPDCREHCYACGILPAYSSRRTVTPDAYWLCPQVEPDNIP